MNLYKNCEIYGPYKSKKDKRSRIVIRWPDKSLTCISYPKYLMELHLGRYLNDDETIDHIDGNVENNDLSNFQILDRLEHVKIDNPSTKSENYICQNCNKQFVMEGWQVAKFINNRKHRPNQNGPFCSRSCVSKYSQKLKRIE